MSHPMMMAFLLVYVAVIGVSVQSVIKPPLLPLGLKSNSDSILKANGNPANTLYEGDIRLTPEEYQQMIAPEPKKTHKRQLNPVGYKWNKYQIQYFFHYSLPSGGIFLALEAFNYYQQHTCLRFEILLYPYIIRSAFLTFGNDISNSCHSSVGRKFSSGSQWINLGTGCMSRRTVLHEIGHALGFWHTQSRPDRDDDSKKDQFNTEFNNRDYGYPYDYMSIMHYGGTDFSINNSTTIYTKNQYYQKLIGTAEEPSFIDLALLNLFYNCAENCATRLECENGGYQNGKKCDECVCAPGYGGPTCAIRAGSEDPATDCGSTLNATSEWQTLEGNINTTCTWWIWSAKDTHIELNIKKFGVKYADCSRARAGLDVTLDHPLITGVPICAVGENYVNFNEQNNDENTIYASKFSLVIINGWALRRSAQSFVLTYRQVNNDMD